MNPEKQKEIIRLQSEALIKELQALYANAFDQLCYLDIGERQVAKLTQLFLLSKNSAIEPLQNVLEKNFTHKST